jgi:hypothetical protein
LSLDELTFGEKEYFGRFKDIRFSRFFFWVFDNSYKRVVVEVGERGSFSDFSMGFSGEILRRRVFRL